MASLFLHLFSKHMVSILAVHMGIRLMLKTNQVFDN